MLEKLKLAFGRQDLGAKDEGWVAEGTADEHARQHGDAYAYLNPLRTRPAARQQSSAQITGETRLDIHQYGRRDFGSELGV